MSKSRGESIERVAAVPHMGQTGPGYSMDGALVELHRTPEIDVQDRKENLVGRFVRYPR